MGKALRPRPARLAGKLLRIRKALGLSQNGMLTRLGFETSISRDYISAYERGKREPPLPVLLEYARAAGVSMETLVDDKLELPEGLSSGSGAKRVRGARGAPTR
jgi:transcriptional regulator with XRE-family HTH domain